MHCLVAPGSFGRGSDLTKLRVVTSCEEASLCLTIAFASSSDSLLLALDVIDAVSFLGELLSHTCGETSGPLFLLRQVLFLGALLQGEDLTLVVDLCGARIKALANVFVLCNPCALHGGALILELCLEAPDVDGDGVPVLSIELLLLGQELSHLFGASDLVLFNPHQQVLGNIQNHRIRVLRKVIGIGDVPLLLLEVSVDLRILLLVLVHNMDMALFPALDFDPELLEVLQRLCALFHPHLELSLVVQTHLFLLLLIELVLVFQSLHDFFVPLVPVLMLFLDELRPMLVFRLVVGPVLASLDLPDALMFHEEVIQRPFDLFNLLGDVPLRFLEPLFVLLKLLKNLAGVSLQVGVVLREYLFL